jgi:hypothetical protein
VLGGPAVDLGPRPEPRLAQDVGDVVTRCALGDPELGGDLAVGEASGDNDHYLRLTARESAQRIASQHLLRSRDCERIGPLLGEGVPGILFERHRASLGQRFCPRRFPQPGTGG